MKEIVIAIILRNRHVLISRRYDHVHMGGLWEFPGGKRELGETVRTAVYRECLEELGLVVDVAEELDRYTWAYEDRTLDLRFYRCTVISGKARPIASQEIQWVPIDELKALQFPAANERILCRLQTGTWE